MEQREALEVLEKREKMGHLDPQVLLDPWVLQVLEENEEGKDHLDHLDLEALTE